MIHFRLIRQPTGPTVELVKTRLWRGTKDRFDEFEFDAIGLVQGYAIEMLAAADIAEKAAPVQVAEILGLCPQHFTLLGVFGAAESVETAISAVEQELGGQWLGSNHKQSFTASRGS